MNLDPQPLPIRVQPESLEVLPSYLARVADQLHTPLRVLVRPVGPAGLKLNRAICTVTMPKHTQTAMASYLNLAVSELQMMLPQYSPLLSDRLAVGAFGELPHHVQAEFTLDERCCPRCRDEQPDVDKVPWMIRNQVICSQHHCLIIKVAKGSSRDAGPGQDAVAAQEHVNQIAASNTIERAAILRGLAAYQRLPGRPSAGSHRGRWLSSGIIEILRDAAQTHLPTEPASSSALTTLIEAHHQGLFNRRYNGPGRIAQAAMLPAVLPMADFVRPLSDLAYPTELYQARHFAALACRGDSPLDVTRTYSTDAIIATVPEYLRMCIRLDTEGRWDQWLAEAVQARHRLIEQGLDYVARRRIVDNGTAAEAVRSYTFNRQAHLLRAWLNEWAGIYQYRRPDPDAYDEFSDRLGPRLEALLQPVERRAVA